MTKTRGPGDDADTDADGQRTARPANAPPRRSRQLSVVLPAADDRLADRGEIAQGGQGVVRKVFDRRLERYAALKALDPAMAERSDALERFLDEARVTGQLDHPNIVPIYDLLGDGVATSFVMKLVEGMTLSERLRRPGAASDQGRSDTELVRLLEIFLKVCDAVAFAHSRGVIHRDLKPNNVMIGEFGEVYVMDWGCALVRPRGGEVEGMPRRTTVDEPGTVIGTTAYMSPEQAWGRTDEIDERTDVYGLGAILYQLLTGVPPNEGTTEKDNMALAREGTPLPPQDVARGRTPPAALSQIAMRALSRERADRYPTVLALRDEIERFLHRGVFFTQRPFPANTLIVREGDRADEAYVITSGRCEVFRDERGRRVLLRTLGPGDVFGEAALFAAEPRNASVLAIEDVTAVVVTRDLLDQELGHDSWVGTFVRALIARFRDLEARHTMTRRVTENARIAAVITSHVSRAGTWVRPGALAASWSRLWTALQSECAISEEAALAIVARTADLKYDPQTDQITLELLAMA